MDAVRRGAVDVAKTVVGPMDIQGGIEGERIGLGAVVVLGCHHLDIGDGRQCIMQGDQAIGAKTIVVGNQDLESGV